VESDSTDNTLDELAALEREIDRFSFISLGNLAKTLPLRTERIALCRNAYLSELARNANYANVEFVAIADFDGVNQLLTQDALLSCWMRNDWAGCTANQQGPYYDIWALRHPHWNGGDCWRAAGFLQSLGLSYDDAVASAVHSKMITLPSSAGWVEVESSFGGFGIYRRASIVGAHYIGVDIDGAEVCEHVAFHKAIRTAGGKLYINPLLVNTGLTQHTRQLSGLGRFLHLCKRLVKRQLRPSAS